ncbi:hypothetical protein TRIUR3_30913 [Triticum urartu]|uniref:Uncharacterized protein n=3 Tax=Triticum TaxID=4564 RepID=A0A9R0SE22_TRITD|nr:hypothetical protein TRIUR3_30913 [Triticum urartu]VAH93659.1 unnamed protein product [Triticum turgidum subsp. durum]
MATQPGWRPLPLVTLPRLVAGLPPDLPNIVAPPSLRQQVVAGLEPSPPRWPALQLVDLEFEHELKQESMHNNTQIMNHLMDTTSVTFHRRYPLFDSSLEDCTAYVFHGMIYTDLNQNPLIVPLEILHGHLSSDRRGVLD